MMRFILRYIIFDFLDFWNSSLEYNHLHFAKVIHDGRQDCDALYAQYTTTSNLCMAVLILCSHLFETISLIYLDVGGLDEAF